MSVRKSRADETCAWLDTLDADTKAEAIRCVLQDAYKDGLRDGQHSAWHALRLGGGYNQMIIRAASESVSYTHLDVYKRQAQGRDMDRRPIRVQRLHRRILRAVRHGCSFVERFR